MEQLRRNVRQYEADVDSKLLAYTRLQHVAHHGATSSSPHFASGHHAAAEVELEGLLKKVSPDNAFFQTDVDKLGESIDALAVYIQSQGSSQGAMALTLQRHRDIHLEYTREFRRIRASIASAREQDELLGSVQEDIHRYKTLNMSQTDALLNEGRRIDGVNQIADNVAAYHARAKLAEQRARFGGTMQRLGIVARQLPGIGTLIQRIQRRKIRDSLIMGVILAIGVISLIAYKS